MTTLESRLSSATEIASIDSQSRRITIVISTNDLDDANRRIDQSGWVFDRFLKNPVICLQHDAHGYSGSMGLPIAKGLIDTIRIENQRTTMDVEFPPVGAFPLADTVFELAKFGCINAVSVGWQPIDVDTTEENGERIELHKKQELLEVSFVTLPSNPNALIQRASSKNHAAAKKLVEQLEESIEQEVKERAAAEELKQFKASHLLKCARYFDDKQKANRESTKVLKAFYKSVLKKDQPENEVEAWKEMASAVEGMEEVPEKPEVTKVEIEEEKPEEKLEEKPIETAPEETPVLPVIQPAPEEPAPKASVSVPLSLLTELPAKLAAAYVDAAVKALRQGTPLKSVGRIIDGMNQSVTSSISLTHLSDGKH